MKRNPASFRPLTVIALLVSLLTAPFLGGCFVVAAGAAGAGAVAYVRGELSSNVPHGLDDTFAACQRAVRDLELIRIDDHKTSLDAQLVSRTALDKKIEIKLERVGDKLTKVSIRVGVMGDQPLSLTILDKINAELK